MVNRHWYTSFCGHGGDRRERERVVTGEWWRGREGEGGDDDGRAAMWDIRESESQMRERREQACRRGGKTGNAENLVT